MPRLNAIDPTHATGKAKTLLEGVQKALGITPNLMRTFANAPAALEGYLAFNGALSGGVLKSKLREQLAITVAEANGCDYCLSAHTAIGNGVGLSPDELERARSGDSIDRRTEAALQFAEQVLEARGAVSDDELAAVRAAGYSDGEVAEIVGHVALNVFTNYFNRLAQTEVDFPRVAARPARDAVAT